MWLRAFKEKKSEIRTIAAKIQNPKPYIYPHKYNTISLIRRRGTPTSDKYEVRDKNIEGKRVLENGVTAICDHMIW